MSILLPQSPKYCGDSLEPTHHLPPASWCLARTQPAYLNPLECAGGQGTQSPCTRVATSSPCGQALTCRATLGMWQPSPTGQMNFCQVEEAPGEWVLFPEVPHPLPPQAKPLSPTPYIHSPHRLSHPCQTLSLTAETAHLSAQNSTQWP